MTLQQQLLYNWQRGFYSVVKDNLGQYQIVSTMYDKESFRVTEGYKTVEEAKCRIGECLMSWGNELESEARSFGYKIVDTIHPSELMGKGFQVGDKVQDAFTGEIFEIRSTRSGIQGNYLVKDKTLSVAKSGTDLTNNSNYIDSRELKPVLHVEEREVCMKCGLTINPNDIGVLRTGTDYLCCYSCDKEVIKVIELLKKTKVIKDGHIVNL